MKTPGIFKFVRRAFLVIMLTWCASIPLARAANSFVEGYSGFKTLDSGVDTEGYTYVIGTRSGTIGVLKKFTPNGLLIYSRDITNSSGIFTPTGFSVGGDNRIYVAADNRLLVLDRDGQVQGNVFQTNGITYSSIVYYPELNGAQLAGAVYACGVQGQNGVISKLTPVLTHITTKLYGSTAGATTANSVVADDAGNVYVGGHVAPLYSGGNFIFSSGFSFGAARGFAVDTYYASDGTVKNLAKIDQMVSGGGVSSSVRTYALNLNVGSIGVAGVRARGQIYIAQGDTYTFYSTTDDGSALYVDGVKVIYDDTAHGTQTTSGSITLRAGVHEIEYKFFNSGGPGNYKVTFGQGASPTTTSLLPAIQNQGNHSYVFQLSPDLSTCTEAFFPTIDTATGGSYWKLAYSGGWIYASGYFMGRIRADGIVSDTSNGQDIEIVKLDTNLKLNGRATVKGAGDQQGIGVTATEDGDVYITGNFGPGSVNFIGTQERATTETSSDGSFASISASQKDIFVAKLDPAFNYEWIKTPQNTPPTFNAGFSEVTVCWNPILERLFWSGSFVQGTLSLGEPNSVISLPAAGLRSFVAVLENDGKYTERVYLTIVSQYGQSRTQVLPYGGTPDIPETQLLIKDSLVAASVPKFIYRDIDNNELPNPSQSTIEQQAEIRFAATGYSLDSGTVTGDKESYTFSLTQDTRLDFRWSTQFALTINSDLSGTRSASGGLASDASGSPSPAVQKHWINQDEIVAPQIDGYVLDLNANITSGLIRYVVTGYNASGPPNTFAEPGEQSETFFPFVSIATRQQVPQFAMTAPAHVTYKWKKQDGIQINTTGFDSASFPLIHVLRDPATALSPQADSVGTGLFWYDEHTWLKILTIQYQDTKQLKRYFNGDGVIFALQGTTNELTASLVANGIVYVGKEVADLITPAKVMWDYGDRIFTQTNFIGNSIRLDSTTIDDPAILSKLRVTTSPDFSEMTVDSGPIGSAAQDMLVWDSGGQRMYPLRPGTMLIPWKTTDADPKSRVMIQVIIKYPAQPHYNHIANTPAVNLDPDATDNVAFQAIKYTEANAVVDSSSGFVCTNAGKSVLLFSETTTGRGSSVQTLRVRVVQTKLWNDNLPAPTLATIGARLVSPFDTAGLGTGYIFFENARYNPFIYNRQTVSGPIIPVNLEFEPTIDSKLVVVWYEKRDKILWPYKPVRYTQQWPTSGAGLNRIVIASRFGSECVATNGADQVITDAMVIGTNSVGAQVTFNPSRFQQVQVYNQPDRALPGYNPNEEHALMAPSLRYAKVSPRPPAAYALRDNDLNVTNRDTTYTSDPYVLVQFFDTLDSQFKMKVFEVVREDANSDLGALSYSYRFDQTMKAGEPVIPFYPLGQVIGATPSPATYGREGAPAVQRTFWKDHKGTGWAVSGDGYFYMYFYYPLAPDFWWPAADGKQAGDAVAFLPEAPGFAEEFFPIDYTLNDQVPPAQSIKYTTAWPDNVPLLKVGETLTYSGGEYKADNPQTSTLDTNGNIVLADTPGLPAVVGWAEGEIVFDTLNPVMNNQKIFDKYTARLFQSLEERTVVLDFLSFPINLSPAGGQTRIKNGNYIFANLPASLQKRAFYDPIRGKLGMKGFLNDKDIADSTLTASPGAVYVLEANLMTPGERDSMIALQPDDSNWVGAVTALYKVCRNPNLLDRNNNGFADDSYFPGLGKADDDYRIGLEQEIQLDTNGLPVTDIDSFGITHIHRTDYKGSPSRVLGPGLALVTNPNFMDPNSKTPDVAYVTLAENNDDSLGSSPVALHIVKVDKRVRYRGSIKTIYSDNVFDENIQLRHTGDFGGNADALVLEWWYRPEDGTEALTPDRAPSPNPWKVFSDPSGNRGQGYFQLVLKGNPSAPEALLADSLFYVRYRHTNDVTDGVNWEVRQPNGTSAIPYQWAGAGNSSPNDLNGDGIPDYKPQLAQGWIKRVLDAVNPYEARINDFSGDAPATYSSMLQEFGQHFEGPVALNPAKNVIESVGLIELYQTILDRGENLSINLSTPVSTPAIANALELAASRLVDFYMLLGNEAYSDAQNPTIGHGSSSVSSGHLPPSVFAFQNEVATLAEEELALLRGVDDNKARPVYNRLFWNFTKGEGEVAYAMNYNVTDVNHDGFINEKDAAILYPQGHGDAWGHYLTAVNFDYGLLKNPFFNWVSRSELYNLNDIVIPVDFLDERKFAQAAAAKAKAGAEILNLTYRSRYVEDPTGQWQGYTDSDKKRGWGVEEWARRAGQGALFDWVTANALLPAVHPNTNYTGIRKVDRTTVHDISVISSSFNAIQRKFDEANAGLNPLGLAGNVVTFDLDPVAMLSDHQTHFDQIYTRAVAALENVSAVLDNANETDNLIRDVAVDAASFQQSVLEEDLSYRNQLIEIFGTPYEGTIGSGQAYPAGYEGPDTMLYMYVDVNAVNDTTVPLPTLQYGIDFSNAVYTSGQSILTIPNAWRQLYAPDVANGAVQNASVLSVNWTDFSGSPNVELQNMNVPVMARGYTFQAPPSWGSRKAPGDLQSIITQMVQAEADLAVSIDAWDGAAGDTIATIKLINSRYSTNQRIYDRIQSLNKSLTASIYAEMALRIGAGVADFAADLTDKTAEDIGNAVASVLPTAGLAFSPGSTPTKPAESGIRLAGLVSSEAFKFYSLALNSIGDGLAAKRDVDQMVADLANDTDDRNADLKESLVDLEDKLGGEAIARVQVFKQIQVLRDLSDKYRAKLAEGQRLVQVRTQFNQKSAAMAQQQRYQDMSFRVSRNAALEKYRSAFDLAARYAYLAGKAYDFDTNLDPTDPGSPLDILSDIVRQRSIGLVTSSGPSFGSGGLAEDLATLKANYDVLRTQMGINNPQYETATFSLRKENFRTLTNAVSDANWKAMLRTPAFYKTNVWEVPEFRAYCRPFAPQSDGPQPALVIPFSTQVRSRNNFFGRPLGPLDSTYDPSVYATKISSVGIGFTHYNFSALPQTPRVYLVPVGADVMTIPHSSELDVRIWRVLDQSIPVPFPALNSNLGDPTWKPLIDSLSGTLGQTRQFSSFRAYGFAGDEVGQLGSFDSRLIGRSVWNSRWLLIIPGAALNADPDVGLNAFIDNVEDVRLIINTYGFSGN